MVEEVALGGRSSALLDLAVRVAKRAGEEALAACRGRVHAPDGDGAANVRTKSGPRDLVTATDFAIERRIREELAESGIPVLGEEGAGGKAPDEWYREPLCWTVDPIDGTTNFVHTLPHFGVAIALLAHGRPHLGVFYDPNAKELFHAVRGEGAFLDGPGGSRRLSVDRRDLPHALLGASLTFGDDAARLRNARALAAVAPRCRNVRILGSAATHLAYVAAGRLSGCWDERLAPWDMAAGVLMVEEAGGVVTATDGAPFRLDQPTVLAANPEAHGELLAVLAAARV